jgi:hypothetical protein
MGSLQPGICSGKNSKKIEKKFVKTGNILQYFM